MSLSQSEIVDIRQTWALAAQSGTLLADLFYAELFRIAPHTRPLFKRDMRSQQKKLTATLGFIVENLDEREAVVDAAIDLALRHVGYGVSAAQYAPVGEALVWALKQLLGPRFGAAEQTAWLKAYNMLATVMIEAAYDQKPSA